MQSIFVIFSSLKARISSSFNSLPVRLTFILGLVNIISAVSPPLSHRIRFLEQFIPIDILTYSRILTLVLGFLLLILSYHLLQRSQRAWQAAVVLVTLSVVGHMIKGIDYAEAVYGLIVLCSLIVTRKTYRLKQTLTSLKKGVTVLVLGLLFAFIYGVIGFYFLDPIHFGEAFSIGDSLWHTARLYFAVGDTSLIPHTIFARLFIASLYGVGIFSVIYGMSTVFQSTVMTYKTLPQEYELAKILVTTYGKSSLDYFKLYWDKSLFFNSDRSAFLAYKVVNNYAIVLADPVAQNSAGVRNAVLQFIDFTQEHGLKLAFQQVSKDYLSIYKELGWSYIKIGEEAEIPLETLDLTKPEYKEFRTTLRKLERQNYSFHMYQPPQNAGLMQKLRQVSDEWLSLSFRTERVFTQGIFEEATIVLTPVATVEDTQGQILAFVNVLPEYAPKHITFDLIRRKEYIPNGTMEFLFIHLCLYYKERECTVLSLGLAPLSGVGENKGAKIPEKTLKFFSNHMNKVFSYKGLRQFKAQFRPIWQPRYFIYQHTLELPALAMASIKAGQVGGVSAFLENILRHRFQTNRSLLANRIKK